VVAAGLCGFALGVAAHGYFRESTRENVANKARVQVEVVSRTQADPPDKPAVEDASAEIARLERRLMSSWLECSLRLSEAGGVAPVPWPDGSEQDRLRGELQAAVNSCDNTSATVVDCEEFPCAVFSTNPDVARSCEPLTRAMASLSPKGVGEGAMDRDGYGVYAMWLMPDEAPHDQLEEINARRPRRLEAMHNHLFGEE
jgi:hypothetical protein